MVEILSDKPGLRNRRKTLGIGLTTRCNYNCRFCVIYDRNRLWGEIGTPAVLKILRDQRKSCRSVIFGGGEPTLRPDLPRLIVAAKRLGYHVQISTNGRKFYYREYCRELIDAGTDIFCVGLSAPNAAEYERATRTRGGFAQVLAGIRNLLSLGQSVMTNTVVSKLNYRYLPSMTGLLTRLGHKRCNLSFVVRPPFMPRSEAFPRMSPSEISVLVRQLKSSVDRLVKAGVTPCVTRVPFCYMKGYEKYLTAYLNDFDKSICLYRKGRDLINVYDYVLFWKNDVCRSCGYDDVCPGIQRDSPFKPRRVR